MPDLPRIAFECDTCGGTVLTVEDKPTDTSTVACKGCGRSICNFGDFKARRVNKALTYILGQVTQKLQQ